VPVVCALLVAAPRVALPQADLGIRRFSTPPVTPNLEIAQTFAMTADGLHAVEVFPAAASGASSGDITFGLYEVVALGTRSNETLVREVKVPVGQLRDASSYRMEFAPVHDSKDHSYRLALTAGAESGVAFRATRGDPYAGGTLLANDTVRWADLGFRTHAPVPSTWDVLVAFAQSRPWRAAAALGALAAVWLVAGAAIRLLPAMSQGMS
jgi:hypothetical protein